MLGVVVRAGYKEGVVSAHPEHVVACLGRSAVQREGVFAVVDCAPVVEGSLEGCFDLPVLDKA